MNKKEKAQLKEYLDSRKKVVDDALDRYLPSTDSYPKVIFEAARYSLFAGGKRIRPVLCMAAAETCGGRVEDVLPCACALEMIHTYSLIHDDLPAMDDDVLRRGKPTSHVVFGEGIAVLAGDALLTDAFRILASEGDASNVNPRDLLSVIQEIGIAAGFFGMIGGQTVDLNSEGKDVDYETLRYIHMHKTGALIKASMRSGAILSGAAQKKLSALTAYGESIGLLFQIVDDILNVEGDASIMGKETGSDTARKKATYPSIVGLELARKRAAELVKEALSSIDSFDDRAEPLRLIARYMAERKS
ncbi:MAG: polyprenyl synthetase family protein [Syntrophales bacterium]|nr:polyprenyl synthetase family protein [Syntrophales bacterium]